MNIETKRAKFALIKADLAKGLSLPDDTGIENLGGLFFVNCQVDDIYKANRLVFELALKYNLNLSVLFTAAHYFVGECRYACDLWAYFGGNYRSEEQLKENHARNQCVWMGDAWARFNYKLSAIYENVPALKKEDVIVALF